MRTNRVYLRVGGIASALSALLVLLSACEPYADPVSLDVDPASLHKDKPHGKPRPDDPPPDPDPGSDGRFGFQIGYDSPHTGSPAVASISVVSGAATFISATVSIFDRRTNIQFLQDQPGGSTCFPDTYEVGVYEAGTWTFTDGRAEFRFGARSADGSASKSYVLALIGVEPFQTLNGNASWPLVQDGSRSAFYATAWTLTPQGKGKKNPGCEGGGDLDGDGIRIGVARGSLDTPSVKAVAPFLYSPFSLPVSPVPSYNIFDHSPDNDGLVINFEGEDVGTAFGYDGNTHYDYAVEGEPIWAAAAGTVIYVGNDIPFYCGLLGTVVIDQLFVAIEHEVILADLSVQLFATVYKRLQSVAVTVGQKITPDNLIVIGQSGDSGCTTTEHLHFSVRAAQPGDGAFYAKYGVRTDPYGRPTEGDPEGMVFNQVLWVDGQAPPVVAVSVP